MNAVKTKTVLSIIYKMSRSGGEVSFVRVDAHGGLTPLRQERYRKMSAKSISRLNRLEASGDLMFVGHSFGKTWMAVYLRPQPKRLA